MKISGMLAGVKDASYTNKKTGEKVELLGLDIYDDEGYGIAACQIFRNKLSGNPTPGNRCTAKVQSTRVFNGVVQFSLSEYSEQPSNGSAPVRAPESTGSKVPTR